MRGGCASRAPLRLEKPVAPGWERPLDLQPQASVAPRLQDLRSSPHTHPAEGAKPPLYAPPPPSRVGIHHRARVFARSSSSEPSDRRSRANSLQRREAIHTIRSRASSSPPSIVASTCAVPASRLPLESPPPRASTRLARVVGKFPRFDWSRMTRGVLFRLDARSRGRTACW